MHVNEVEFAVIHVAGEVALVGNEPQVYLAHIVAPASELEVTFLKKMANLNAHVRLPAVSKLSRIAIDS